MIDALREYAEDWQEYLLDAPNHRDNWGLEQLVALSEDDQLRDWLVGFARRRGRSPTREDHDRFCRIEGWRRVRNARGRAGTHRVICELDLPDGRPLRTRVSHPVDRSDDGPSLWRHILRDQLQVSEADFWACVRDGIKPDRGIREPQEHALPADLVHLLISPCRPL